MSYDDLVNETDHAARVPSSVPNARGRAEPAGQPGRAWPGLDTRLTPNRSMSAGLADRLSRDIHAGTLRPGDRLPTEQQLGAALGVSRTVVREAMAALRGEGLVVARQGSGLFVAPASARQPFRIDPDALDSLTNVLNLMELRTGVESEAAGLAAARRIPADLLAMDGALHDIDTVRRAGGDPAEADHAFHRAILLAAHNAYFADFGRYLGQFIAPRQSIRTMAVPPSGRAAYLRRVQAEHRAIRDAINARDEAAAREAAQRHLRNSQARFGRLRDRLRDATA